MRKTVAIFLTLLSLTVLSSPAAWAMSPAGPYLSTTYTVDNISSNLLLISSSGTFSLGGKSSAWESAETAGGYYLNPGETYSLVWKAANFGTPDAKNPTGFLGQVSIGSSTFLSGVSKGWSVAGNAPVVFGASGSAFNDDPSSSSYMVWEVSPGAGIYGIDTAARWIGQAAGGQGKLEAYDVAFRFTATNDGAVAVTPIPGALWLLGGGVAGLAALRRRFGSRQA